MRDELNEQDFLDRAIVELARTHKNADRMGDPVWCEIIAKDVGNLAQALLDERRKVRRGESTTEQFEKIETFDVDLIERLARALQSYWENSGETNSTLWLSMARKVVTELASGPREMPNIFACESVAYAGWNPHATMGLLAAVRRVHDLFHVSLAPILAAKDAEIERLKQANIKLVTAAMQDPRIATPANSCTDAERQQYEQTIRLQVEKIMDLEKRLADLSAPTVRDMSYDDMVRAFGQEGVGHIVELALDKTGRKETAEALQRVRDRVGVPLILGNVQRDIVFEFIDKELARLGQ